MPDLPDLPRPPDHDARMVIVRRLAAYELGSASWAGVFISAYFYPTGVIERIESEIEQ